MTTIISHSEVDQFLTCERKHYYAFGQIIPGQEDTGLESKHLSDGLYRGTLGHAALEALYKTLSEGHGYDKAKSNLDAVLTDELVSTPERSELIMSLMIVLNAYCDYYYLEDTQEWEYIAVEEEFRYEVDDDIIFPFKPDMIRRHRKTQQVQVVDHKFLQRLYGPSIIGIQPQLPKYVGSLRRMGYDVKDGVYNLISHSVLKTRPYVADNSTMRRVPLKLTNQRIARSLNEQHEAVRQIAELKADPESWPDKVLRTANSFNCQNCPFLDLCVADLNGEDTTVMLRHEFRPNSYGYDKVKVDD
jgi:CRISPR/Cas system-associated exonuclease Cas4 (RecB family)